MKTNKIRNENIDKFIAIFNPYLNKSVVQLCSELNIHKIHEGINPTIVKTIVNGSYQNQECILYNKKYCVNKTVTVTENGKAKENMSFGKIDFHDMKTKDWKNSKVYHYFSNKTFILFVFQREKDETILKKIFPLELSKDDLYEIFLVWERVKTLFINNTLIIGGKHNHSVMNFPKSRDSSVAHVRPHDKNSKVGKVLLPDGNSIINYSFWLNKKLIEAKIKEIKENV